MSLEAPIRETYRAAAFTLGEREIPYSQAVNEALFEAMAKDDSVFVIGQNITDATGVFGTCLGLADQFGSERVIEAPLSETATAGWIAGAAIRGMRPVLIMNRPDFIYLMMDQLINHASKWHYMFDGKMSVPITVWAPVARGWGTACQHTQALHGTFMHFPGVKVVTPSNPSDSKGLLISSIFDDNPVMVFDHRRAMRIPGHAAEGYYDLPLGEGAVVRDGKDITLVTLTLGVHRCMEAADALAADGIEAEVIDLRTVKPLDIDLVLTSVLKTGRAVIVDDSAWPLGGLAAELSATIGERLHGRLKTPTQRVTCPDAPAPSSYVLEDAYYPDIDAIVGAVREAVAFNA